MKLGRQFFLLASLLLPFPHSISAATHIVTTANDELDTPALEGSNQLSLREAIRDASAGDIITFEPSLSGETLRLEIHGSNTGDLILDKDLTIDATNLAESFIIDADNKPLKTPHRVVTIEDGTNVTLNHLTITGGNPPNGLGGGIYSINANLTLNNCTIHHNSVSLGIGNIGGGVCAISRGSGTMSLVINKSTIYRNSSNLSGGGISITSNTENAEVIISNSTITHNRAITNGGGIQITAMNGGKLTARVINSTISRNHTGWRGGGIYNLALKQFSGNPEIVVFISNSIVAQNHAAFGPDIYNIPNEESSAPTEIIIEDTSLITDLSDSALTTSPDIIIAKPLLAPLANYGGQTLTTPPLLGSPTIDAGGMATESSEDQRGLARLSGNIMDIGAVEIQDTADTQLILETAWPLDNDHDGSPFGLETALGTDPYSKEPLDGKNLLKPEILPSGETDLTFGINVSAAPYTIWVLKRSNSLFPSSFQEIYRLDGPSMTETLQSEISSKYYPLLSVPDSVTVTDHSPNSPEAFYYLEAILATE